MNTKNLKSYAPKARKQFIEAVKKRAAHFGIYEDRIAEVRIEGGAAIIEGRAFTRKEGKQRKRLESKLAERGYDMFTREIAYTWFNRLAALRYMEIHDYFDHGFRVLSPAKSHLSNADSLPEILNHASDVANSLNLDKDHIIELQLAGDKEEELYRELLLGQCHQLAKIMPQIFKGLAFESIDDATELLLPNNLTKTDSILKGLINDIPEEDWQEIEVIGWLYQFYISEHKDSVIGKVVKSEDIPAATQLFTPNWIVKYLVQNSVGRQWLATYPDSDLKDKMEYYIEPAEQSEDVIEQLKAITPTSIDPEEIKVLDPACGSGHILVEVYEVLREIYLERGYRLREIPELILTKNIYGLDIDDRAAQLAGFALMMKAREDDRRIFQRVEDGEVTLNVLSLQSSEHLDIHKLWNALDLEGKHHSGTTAGLFDEVVQPNDFAYNEQSDKTIPAQASIYADYYQLLQILKTAFLQAKTFGSLIHIDNKHLQQLLALKELLQAKEKGSDPAAKQAALEVLPMVNQATLLAQRYDSVIANPPYMGSKGMNLELKEFARTNFPNSKADLFSMFMERAFNLLTPNGYNAQVNMQVWMFLSSYSGLRDFILNSKCMTNMAHLGPRAFGQISGEVVQTVAWTIKNTNIQSYKPVFFRLTSGNEDEKRQELLSQKNRFDSLSVEDFNDIPGSPVAYWVNDNIRSKFKSLPLLNEKARLKHGMSTGNNEKFIRFWHEVDLDKFNTPLTYAEHGARKKWFPYNKGGSFRKWYGNNELVLNYEHSGRDLISDNKLGLTPGFRHDGRSFYFRQGLTWSSLSSSDLSVRRFGEGFIFADKGQCLFSEMSYSSISAFLNSNIVGEIIKVLSPTVDFSSGYLEKLPIPDIPAKCEDIEEECYKLSKLDWDSTELSWEFVKLDLLNAKSNSISESYLNRKSFWSGICEKLLNLQNENNLIFAELFGLEKQNVVTDSLEKISLFRNIEYSYKGDSNKMQRDYFAEVISFSIGLLMGRFSLDRDGLAYAHSCNQGFRELESEGAFKSFSADDDGIVPLASEEWLFDDDATTRFKEFVKTVWGDEHLSENLEFVAESLCLHALKPKKGESPIETIRRYFSTQFFKDHCKTYKKRPIYWLFSSGKEKAFECLVYLHRYNEGTLSRMRTEYVTPLMGKYEAQHTLLTEQQLQATGTEARGIEKDLKSLEKKQAELRTFDEQLKHYAEKRITLDLDDGVKANYGKFGNLLADVKAIHGKAVK
ncbi:BREX-1 system adenine-specific DNA-methyltransferase PglX [Pseudoalteromonas sp. 2CM28B]|uniref:BREX-1 system adenine-specific DNA-methyltransferase PglX n=1 Tax=Pseudoalteromonas sp. 2CM28B TaxID=2929851 RepID=UPI0020C0E981|nr:BREX-1 system adenine-specific DNA-methyltransferase PglX [Pseudoalteromonas sp. 2CM28B]MCK8136736.1 BREX-1 system adenine-specific DNA-methyltransferase PglX [Pseudoalteromonas sp. 2CM28B]